MTRRWETLLWLAIGCGMLLVGSTSLGCAASFATMSPARLPPPGHLQLSLSGDYPATTGELAEGIADLESLAGNDGTLDREQLEKIAEGAATGLVLPPLPSTQMTLSYGVAQRVSVEVRSTAASLRGGVRYQFLRARPGIYGAIGLGAGVALYGVPIDLVTDRADVTRFSRREFDAAIHFGVSGRVAHVWIGGKAWLSGHEARLEVCANRDCSARGRVDLDGRMVAVGAQAGLAIGYRTFWIAAELTAAHVALGTDALLTAPGVLAARTYSPAGLALIPAIGVVTWF